MALSLFPRLPLELRLQIWLETLPKERRFVPHAASRTPVIAAVNHESREVFLSVYTKCFHPNRLHFSPESSYQISQYANLTLDVFLYEWDLIPSELKGWLTPEAVQGTKHMAILSGSHGLLPVYTHQLTNLETISLLMTPSAFERGQKLRQIRDDGRLVEVDEQDPKWDQFPKNLICMAKTMWESRYKVTLVDFVIDHPDQVEVVESG